jgi:hypothetical protein
MFPNTAFAVFSFLFPVVTAFAGAAFAWHFGRRKSREDRLRNAIGYLRGIDAEIDYAMDTLGVTLNDAASRRRRVIDRLYALRNALVHAKAMRYSGMVEHPADEERPSMADAWLVRRVRVPKVRLYVSVVYDYCEWLHPQIRPQFDDLNLRQSAFRGTTQAQTSGTSLLSG